jgi:hypothetical protein
MDVEKRADWREMYNLALFETDPAMLPIRIDDARSAIHSRTFELWGLGTADSGERSQLDAASYFLGLLRAIAMKKEPRALFYSAASNKRPA